MRSNLRGIRICHFFILFFLLLGISIKVFSQAPKLNFKHLNKENGLSDNSVGQILQDSRGYMWFTTFAGLNRYDGYKVQTYKNKLGDSSSIIENWISSIHQDKKGNLWVGTGKGLNKFNYVDNTFERFTSDKCGIPEGNYIYSMYTDKKGNFLVISDKALFLYNYKNKKFAEVVNFKKGPHSALGSIRKLFEDSKGNFFVLTDKGLNIFDYKTFSYHPFLLDNKKVLRDSTYHSIVEDKKGNIWIGSTSFGVTKLNLSKKLFKVYNNYTTSDGSSNSNACLLVDKQDNLWLGQINGGLDLYDPSSDKFYNYRNDAEDPNSLSDKSVSALYADIQGNLWVGTRAGGVDMYSSQAKKLVLFKAGKTKNDLSYKDIRALAEDIEGNILVGTDGGGLNIMNRSNQTFKILKNDPKDSKTLSSDAVISLLRDRDDAIWVGTWGGGLNLYDSKTSTFSRFQGTNKESLNINSMYEDKRKNFWVATYNGGLNLFDRKSKTFSKIDTNKTNFKGENISYFGEDNLGNLWISSNKAINRYNYKTGKFSNYYIKKNNVNLGSRVIFCDKKGRIWAGEKGLYLFDPAKKVFTHSAKNSDLQNLEIQGILEDEKGSLWISTNNGLFRFNPETLEIKKFHKSEGIQGLDFRRNSALKAKNGEMFFGGSNGLNSFFPANIKTNKHIPPVYITDFQIFNKPVIPGSNSFLKGDIQETKEITLTYKEAVFSFEFSAINYILTENNQYAYKMDGFEKHWNYVGSKRTATYTNLDPGEYTFRVKASNNDGVWNEKGASIKIIITPPYWATWWF